MPINISVCTVSTYCGVEAFFPKIVIPLYISIGNFIFKLFFFFAMGFGGVVVSALDL